MNEKFHAIIPIRNYHVDSYGHVNNAQYLIILEEARSQALEILGFPFEELSRQGLSIFLSEARLRFLKPVNMGEQVEIVTWFPEHRRAKMIWQQEIYRRSDGELMATATIIGGFVQSGKVIPIPPPIFAALARYVVKA